MNSNRWFIESRLAELIKELEDKGYNEDLFPTEVTINPYKLLAWLEGISEDETLYNSAWTNAQLKIIAKCQKQINQLW